MCVRMVTKNHRDLTMVPRRYEGSKSWRLALREPAYTPIVMTAPETSVQVVSLTSLVQSREISYG